MSRRQRIGAATGMLAPIVAFTCILTAIASYPTFSWTHNALSDLGVVSGVTGPLFNFGLYTGGLLALNFAVFGLYAYFGKSRVGKVGALVFAATASALICIGIFNESFGRLHFLFSVAFFVLLPISSFILTVAFAVGRQLKMALLTIVIGAAAATPWILYFTVHFVPGEAIPESISSLAGSIWVIIVGYKILKQTSFP